MKNIEVIFYYQCYAVYDCYLFVSFFREKRAKVKFEWLK